MQWKFNKFLLIILMYWNNNNLVVFKNLIRNNKNYLLVKLNRDMAAATEAFKLGVLPLREILNIESHFFWVSKEIPLSSEPTTTTKGAFSLKFEIDIWPFPDKPTKRKPFFLSSSSALFRLTTLLTWRCSKAVSYTHLTLPTIYSV